MRNEAIAATHFGVDTVSLLSKSALDGLARWLCVTEMYHDDRHRRGQMTQDQWDKSETIFEEQCERNEGYCDACRDFAGRLLSQFDLGMTA